MILPALSGKLVFDAIEAPSDRRQSDAVLPEGAAYISLEGAQIVVGSARVDADPLGDLSSAQTMRAVE
jgi:hypothetical protein